MKTQTTGRLRPGTERVSYVEDKSASAALRLLAAAKRTNVSALIREAVAQFLKKEDPDKDLARVANHLGAIMADSREARAAETLDAETQKAIAEIFRKHRKKV
jgi:predicted transcriptional regulator